jgi:hypothetical protein
MPQAAEQQVLLLFCNCYFHLNLYEDFSCKKCIMIPMDCALMTIFSTTAILDIIVNKFPTKSNLSLLHTSSFFESAYNILA